MWLDVAQNNLNKLDELATMEVLQQLRIRSNNVKNLKPLERCARLQVLDVQDNNLKDEAAVLALGKRCPELRLLRIWNNDYSKAGVKRLTEGLGNRPTPCTVSITQCADFRMQSTG